MSHLTSSRSSLFSSLVVKELIFELYGFFCTLVIDAFLFVLKMPVYNSVDVL